ncbi:hypothetical protein DIPPA_27273 [Diplonema papillatum]|nr:hypothetical protein DIPPA_27273 [Diplonema papillatum]
MIGAVLPAALLAVAALETVQFSWDGVFTDSEPWKGTYFRIDTRRGCKQATLSFRLAGGCAGRRGADGGFEWPAVVRLNKGKPTLPQTRAFSGGKPSVVEVNGWYDFAYVLNDTSTVVALPFPGEAAWFATVSQPYGAGGGPCVVAVRVDMDHFTPAELEASTMLAPGNASFRGSSFASQPASSPAKCTAVERPPLGSRLVGQGSVHALQRQRVYEGRWAGGHCLPGLQSNASEELLPARAANAPLVWGAANTILRSADSSARAVSTTPEVVSVNPAATGPYIQAAPPKQGAVPAPPPLAATRPHGGFPPESGIRSPSTASSGGGGAAASASGWLLFYVPEGGGGGAAAFGVPRWRFSAAGGPPASGGGYSFALASPSSATATENCSFSGVAGDTSCELTLGAGQAAALYGVPPGSLLEVLVTMPSAADIEVEYTLDPAAAPGSAPQGIYSFGEPFGYAATLQPTVGAESKSAVAAFSVPPSQASTTWTLTCSNPSASLVSFSVSPLFSRNETDCPPHLPHCGQPPQASPYADLAGVLVPAGQTRTVFIEHPWTGENLVVVDYLGDPPAQGRPGGAADASVVALSLSNIGDRCVDGCKGRGSCENLLVATADHHAFAAASVCACNRPFNAWGCREYLDGSEFPPRFWALVLTNLAFLPVIAVALSLAAYVEAVIFSVNMCASAAYHMCDENVARMCLWSYDDMQFFDFFTSSVSFWITLLYMARLRDPERELMLVLGLLAVTATTKIDRQSVFALAVPIAVGGVCVFRQWIAHCAQARRRKGSPRASLLASSAEASPTTFATLFHHLLAARPFFRWGYLIVGLTLAVLGLVDTMVLETDENYPTTHSAWHVLIAFSPAFLLLSPTKSPPAVAASDRSSDVSAALNFNPSSASMLQTPLGEREASYLMRRDTDRETSQPSRRDADRETSHLLRREVSVYTAIDDDDNSIEPVDTSYRRRSQCVIC